MRLVAGTVKLIPPPSLQFMTSKFIGMTAFECISQLIRHFANCTSLHCAILLFTCSEYENSYSFSSPTDDWPSMSSDMEEANTAVRSHMRRGPLKTIRQVAGRFKDIIVQ